ncbi:MAG: glycoside hydrolase family 127 protein, partial [Pirellulaceae bacterium]|nr:glycoside hydrolase family 127 protein [Pirellulaceae bacterium]
VAHFQAAGKRSLLDVAEKFADHIDGVFGPDKLRDPPGHEEIELALVKLYRLTGKEKYLKLAEFFIDARGNVSRPQPWGREYQDHLPVREQDEIFGHAVRAMYLGAGVADLAAHNGDRALNAALDRLWSSMVRRKMYVTGGVGSIPKGECFGADFELPNDTAYCETCAAIGVVFWAQRMNLNRADGQYADVMERALYNGALSGVALDGEHFFYVNPLESDGKHHRQPFYPCACCPPNVVRLIAAMPGLVYAVGGGGGLDEIYVNLYVEGKADVKLKSNRVRLAQKTRYPWDGKVRLTVEPERAGRFALCLRTPAWCGNAAIAVNGQAMAPLKIEKGYARLEREWLSGDAVELDLPMPVERIEANPRVEADRGRTAICRGPIVYCFEAVDNGGAAKNIVLPADPKFNVEFRPDLLGGVAVISGIAQDGRRIVAVPYHVWNHREPGEMIVWARQEGKSPNPAVNDPAWADTLYRPLDPAALEDVPQG